MTKRTIQLTEIYGADNLTLDANATTTRDGYLPAFAKVARSGIQLYRGVELDPANEFGMRDKKVVRVWRSPDEVFSADSMKSYAYKPVTLDHPADLVTAKTWKEHAIGQMGGDVLRDGTFVRVPVLLMDQQGINAVKDRNIKELSAGYTMDLAMEAGTTPEGEAFDASMSNIRINHLAVVRAARGGPELRIGDEDKHKEKLMKTFTCDGVSVSAEDIHAQVIERAITTRDSTIADLKTLLTNTTADAKAAKDASDKAATEAATKIGTKDGEIAALTQKLKDAVITPAMMDKAVTERFEVFSKAKSVLGDKFDFKGKTIDDVKLAVVSKKLGDDKAKAYAADGDTGKASINAAFEVITADIKIGDGVTKLATVITGAAAQVQDNGGDDNGRTTAFDALLESEANAWKQKPGQQQAA